MPEQSTKKRKQTTTVVDIEKPTKKSKKEKRDKKDKKDKGKTRDTEFHVVKTSLVVSIAPTFASNPRTGVEEMLDSMVMRYIPALRGVVLSHSNLRFLSKTATIQADCPYLICSIEFDATIWSPQVGMSLVGKVNLCSPDHVSLLLHRTFNVSIPRHHIPKDEWEFEYGPAENDPEFGPEANEDGDAGMSQKTASDSGGKWPDPFSPQHVPQSRPATKASPGESERERAEVADQIGVDEENEEDLESDDGVAAAEAARRAVAKEVALAEKEKKRKRKEEEKEKKEKRQKKTT
ncbi:hypothetical protein H0H87_001283 [Tephrocybe sp. NHM501043]|nr:hypothetical protein H0H87_001283 [Tephrocybe sp. NHM501043]